MHPLFMTGLAWLFVIVWISGVIFTQRKHHPKALFYLFFTELWERFSYYGMRALLILYMTKEMLYGDDQAFGIYGAYGALVYATPVIGGFLAEKFLGYRNAILLGAILMAVGHFFMAFEYEMIFYAALGFLIVGNGFFKPNISSMVGSLYNKGDRKRDSAFTLFYMGINSGAFLTPFTCGVIGEIYGFHWGFGIAGIGMLLGLIIFWYGRNKGYYGQNGLSPVHTDPTKAHLKKYIPVIILGSVITVPFFAFLVNQNEITKWILMTVGIGVLLVLLVMAFYEDKVHKERIFVLLILFVFTIMFWTFFELAGSAITLFTDRNVDRNLLGINIPTSTFQSVNPFFIIVIAPFFAWVWEKSAKINREPSSPLKFSLALVQLGLGFAVLVVGSWLASPEYKVSLWFLVLAYLLFTTGELFLSPIGLSLVTKLAPGKIVAFVMGVWFLSSSFAHIIGSEISKITTLHANGATIAASLRHGLESYTAVFQNISYISICSGVILLFMIPLLRKWMHGVN
jgi:POT family proton-dependent oligopeptide transporter